MPRCRSCNAPIVWVRTTNTTRLMPVDAEPNPAGNVDVWGAALPSDARGDVRRGTVHSQPPLAPQGVLHMPHHATCPNADQWRRRG